MASRPAALRESAQLGASQPGEGTGVNALPGDRFLVWRPDPAKEPRSTTGLAFGDVRVDVVQASTGVVEAFAPQVGFGAETSLYVDPANSVVCVAGIQIQSPLQGPGASVGFPVIHRQANDREPDTRELCRAAIRRRARRRGLA